MYLQAVGDSFVDGGEELLVLDGTVAAADFGDHGPVGDVERSKQAGHTVATVVVGTPLRHAGHHRQDRVGAVQSLDLAFLVNTEHHRVLQGVLVTASHVGYTC